MILYFYFCFFSEYSGLYQVSDKFLSVARKIVDDRNLNHSVATWLLLHRCASNIYKNLSSKRRVVNLHVVLEQLVVSLA